MASVNNIKTVDLSWNSLTFAGFVALLQEGRCKQDGNTDRLINIPVQVLVTCMPTEEFGYKEGQVAHLKIQSNGLGELFLDRIYVPWPPIMPVATAEVQLDPRGTLDRHSVLAPKSVKKQLRKENPHAYRSQ